MLLFENVEGRDKLRDSESHSAEPNNISFLYLDCLVWVKAHDLPKQLRDDLVWIPF